MNHFRQLDILNPSDIVFPVSIIGCGGIGSPTALMLSKVGYPEINLIDPDLVEEHNLPNQLFPLSAIGQKKVDACAEMMAKFSNCSVKTFGSWNSLTPD